MSYESRGPGRPRQYPVDPQDTGGSVRSARERLAREQERRQRSNSKSSGSRPPIQDLLPPKPLSPHSQYALDSQQQQQQRGSPQWPSHRERPPPQQSRGMPSQQAPTSRRERSPPQQGTGMPSQQAPTNRRDRLPIQQGIGMPPQVPPPSIPELASNSPRLGYVERAQMPAPSFDDSPRRIKTISQVSNTSLGSIPDFPVPVNTNFQAPQPSPTRGRGYSAQYSQYSNQVAPIREESATRNSIKSYASSTVIPHSMSRVPEFYYEVANPSDEDLVTSERVSPIPVRTASVGRRGKPSVTAIRSSRGKDNREFKEVMPSSSEEALVGKEVVPDIGRPGSAMLGMSDIRSSRNSRQLSAYLNDLEHEIRNSRVSMLKQVQKSNLSDRVGSRIPSPLNVNSVRDAEARGSLTSLPDLIRRATKLAANLDRGRTASRLGLEWMGKDADLDLKDVNEDEKEEIRPDIDDSMQTGTTLRNPTPRDEWQPPQSSQHRKSTMKTRRRRWCGMSGKGFSVIMIILALLIAAAVVIPVILIVVIPKKHTTNAVASGSCSDTMTCENGGIVQTLPGGTCFCLCSDGYSGTICQDPPEPACTTVDTQKIKQATIGSLIPPLITSAKSNFSIPLVEDTLVMRFGEFNMTCPVSNALVTFPTITNKRSMLESSLLDNVQRRDQLIARQQPANGAAATATSTAAGTTTTGTVVGEADLLTGATNSTTNDFARIAILFLLQDSDSLSVTQTAQQNIYTFLHSASKNDTTVSQAQNITLGNGYTLNLWDWTVTLRNGTVYGNGWNGTAT